MCNLRPELNPWGNDDAVPLPTTGRRTLKSSTTQSHIPPLDALSPAVTHLCLVRSTAFTHVITIANCFDMNEALHLQMVLGGAGIDAFIPDEITGTIAPYVFFGSGLRLQVAEKDAERAAVVIAREKKNRDDPE